MKRTAILTSVLIIGFAAGICSPLFSHCEIPCGIYGDDTRFTLLAEHIKTIEKSMDKIQSEGKNNNYNQIVRWVNNKEEHANEIQHIVTQYFMTQRVKPKAKSDKGYDSYVKQLAHLHSMLVYAMKCKQTTDKSHTTALTKALGEFKKAYEGARKKSGKAEQPKKHDHHHGHGHSHGHSHG